MFNRLQRALIIMKNKFWSKRVQINKELSDVIAKPLCSNKQVMELTERIDLLLVMKERAKRSLLLQDLVNAQSESESLRQSLRLPRSNRISICQDSCPT